MPSTFFTAADVLTAIRNGHTTIDALAAHFGVPAASYNLRADLADLYIAGFIDYASTGADGTCTFTATPDRKGTRPMTDRLDTDEALAALRDVLNRQRTIDQLQPGDKVRMPSGQVWTFVASTRHGEYASAQFAEADLPMPVGADTLFTLAD